MDNPFDDVKDTTDDSPFIPKAYKCTVVSLLPFETMPENKPHILPSTFVIPMANPKSGIGILHIGEGRYNVPNYFDDRNIPVTVSPNEMARSVVEDFVSAQIGLDEDACPGLFWVPGELTIGDTLKHYKSKIDEYKAKQKHWFKNLVDMADADFVKNRNRLSISDLQKAAARALGYTAEWVDFIIVDMKKCQFCQSSVPEGAVKCPTCAEVIDFAAYKKMKEKENVA